MAAAVEYPRIAMVLRLRHQAHLVIWLLDVDLDDLVVVLSFVATSALVLLLIDLSILI